MAGSKPRSESYKERSAETTRKCVAVSEEYFADAISAAKTSSESESVAFKFGAVVRNNSRKTIFSCVSDAAESIADSAANLRENISAKFNKSEKHNVITTVKNIEKSDENKTFGEVVREKNPSCDKRVKAEKIWEQICGFVKDNKKTVGIVCACLIIVIGSLFAGTNYTFAYETYINGKVVTIDKVENFSSIVASINEHLNVSFGENAKLFDENDYTLKKKLVKKGSLMPEDEVKSAIINSSNEMYDMYVVYAGETALLGVVSEDVANSVISEFVSCYTGGDETVEVTFDKDLHYVHESAPANLLMSDVSAAVLKLNGGEKQENTYVVSDGENAWSIAQKFETSVDKILALNNLSENDIINIGDELIVEAFVPVVNVTTKQNVNKTVDIPYETEVVKDSNKYNTWSEITVKGVNGKKDVLMQVVKVNGNVTEENEISSTIIQQPITQIKTVGTKEPPKGVGTGSFMTPARGYISSRYGYRSRGFHTGLDIAGSYGSAIVAADDGKVIFVGRSGGYGNLVKIDHQNGYVTYYAHNSSFAVKVGQTVTKGQTIAYMGSTGNSTGNHCHFEIFKNGTRQNPEKYI